MDLPLSKGPVFRSLDAASPSTHAISGAIHQPVQVMSVGHARRNEMTPLFVASLQKFARSRLATARHARRHTLKNAATHQG